MRGVDFRSTIIDKRSTFWYSAGMNVKVSSKYQVVIPRAVRKQLGIKAGQKLNVAADENGNVVLKKDTTANMDTLINKYAGSLKTSQTAWGKAGLSSTEWLRKQRDEAWD